MERNMKLLRHFLKGSDKKKMNREQFRILAEKFFSRVEERKLNGALSSAYILIRIIETDCEDYFDRIQEDTAELFGILLKNEWNITQFMGGVILANIDQVELHTIMRIEKAIIESKLPVHAIINLYNPVTMYGVIGTNERKVVTVITPDLQNEIMSLLSGTFQKTTVFLGEGLKSKLNNN
jgi:hypothetical protein